MTLHNTSMSGNQLTYENTFKVFLTSETMSIYFLFGLSTLLDFLRLLVSFFTRSGILGAEILGLALLLSSDPRGIFGLTLVTICGLGKLVCTPWAGLRNTHFLLVVYAVC